MPRFLIAAVVALLPALGHAELLSLSFEPKEIAPIPINPTELDGYAIWGTGVDSDNVADIYDTGGLFSPMAGNLSNGNPLSSRGPLQPPRWEYVLDFDSVYGAIGHNTEEGMQSPIGEGFSFFLTPGSDIVQYSLLGLAWNGTAIVNVRSEMGDILDSLTLEPFSYGWIRLAARGEEPLSMDFTIEEGTTGYDGSNVTIGLLTAEIQAVPEPIDGNTIGWIVCCLMLAECLLFSRLPTKKRRYKSGLGGIGRQEGVA